MPARKRKKYTRYRGSHTHGGGHKKKRRGAGNRGGRGLAGSGKRAHHNKQRIFKLFGKDYFGRKGFISKNKAFEKSVNIYFLEENLERLIERKLVAEKDGIIEIDLAKLGYDKLLSTGKPTRKYKIIAKRFSKKSKEKIESAGGGIVNV